MKGMERFEFITPLCEVAYLIYLADFSLLNDIWVKSAFLRNVTLETCGLFYLLTLVFRKDEEEM